MNTQEMFQQFVFVTIKGEKQVFAVTEEQFLQNEDLLEKAPDQPIYISNVGIIKIRTNREMSKVLGE